MKQATMNSQMSVDRKRKSWHWFLLVGLQKRVINQDLDDSTPIADINRVDNSLFVPNLEDCNYVLTFIFTLIKKVKHCIV
jgi:hypothetical protein